MLTPRTRSLLVAAALLAPLAVASCGVEGTGLLISDAQEADLGAQVNDQVLIEYPPINDAEIQAWVDDLGGRIAAVSVNERSGVAYRFQVLDSDLVNAFAAPGGYVYLTRGLILTATSEAEVAGVLGHEVGHVAHRHGVAKLERIAGASLISDLIFGEGSVGSDLIVTATNILVSTEYSQDQETDADNLGVQFTLAAGISPFGMVDFFERLAAQNGNPSFLDFLSSHPNPADRAINVQNRIQRLQPGLTRDSPNYAIDVTGNFANIQARLR